MSAAIPGDDDYEAGNIHTADDFRRVAEQVRAPRDVVRPDVDLVAWQRTTDHAGHPGLIAKLTELAEDVDGLPLAVKFNDSPIALGRPVGQPTMREEIDAWCADPRNELGDEYDPEVDGPLPPGVS